MPLNCFLTEKILWSTSSPECISVPTMASSFIFPSNSLIQKTCDLFQTNRPSLAECDEPIQPGPARFRLRKGNAKRMPLQTECTPSIKTDTSLADTILWHQLTVKMRLIRPKPGKNIKNSTIFKIFLDSLQRDSHVVSTQKEFYKVKHGS